MNTNEPGAAVLAIFDQLINRVKQAVPVRSDDKPLGGGRVYSMMTLGMPVDPLLQIPYTVGVTASGTAESG